MKFAAISLLFLLVLTYLILTLRGYQTGDLPDPPSLARADGCVVSPEATKVHEKYEDAWIQFVNADSTVQVQTVDTKLAILFEVKPDELVYFRKGSITPVTISECVENSDGECDFSMPHTVFVRTELVEILNWKYLNNAP